MALILRSMSLTTEEAAVLRVVLTAAKGGSQAPLSAEGRKVLDRLMFKAEATSDALIEANRKAGRA